MQLQARSARFNPLPLIGIALASALGIMVTSPHAELAVGTVGVLVYVILILRDRFLGFLLLTVTYPFSPYLFLDISIGASIPDLTLSRLCLGLLVLLILAEVATGRRRPLPLTRLDVFAVLSLMGIGLSVTMAEGFARAGQSFLDAYVMPIMFYWIAKVLVQNKSDRTRVVFALLIVAAYSSAIAIQEQFTGNVLFLTAQGTGGRYSDSIRRLAGLYGSPVVFGVILGMAFPFAIHFVLVAKRSKARLMWSLLALFILIGLYASAVRTAWGVALLGLLVLGLFHPSLSRPQVRRVIVSALLLAAVVSIPLGPAISRSVFEAPIVGERVQSAGPIVARLVMYGTGWRVFQEFPLRGVGYENFSRVFSRYLTGWGDIPAELDEATTAPHNSFMYVLVSAGLLGFIPYVLMAVFIVISILRVYRREVDTVEKGLIVAFWVAMLSYFLNAMTSDVVYLRQNSIYFFTLLGAFLAHALGQDR